MLFSLKGEGNLMVSFLGLLLYFIFLVCDFFFWGGGVFYLALHVYYYLRIMCEDSYSTKEMGASRQIFVCKGRRIIIHVLNSILC